MGIQSLHVKDLVINGGSCIGNGHPEANSTVNVYADPGYGYASVTANEYSQKVTVSNLVARGNVRKGLDSHAGEDVNFINNTVEDNGVCGIYTSTSSATQLTKNINISGNKLKNNSFANSALGAIYVGGDATIGNMDISTNIENNFIDGWGVSAIRGRYVENLNILSNVIKDSLSTPAVSLAGIIVQGQSSLNMSTNVVVSNNKIYDKTAIIKHGIRTDFVDMSSVTNNNVEYNSINNIGYYATNCGYVDFMFNKAKLATDGGSCFVLAQTKGFCDYNTAIGGIPGYLYPNISQKTRVQPIKAISFDITFNGSTPAISKIIGSDNIGTVSTTPNDMTVSLTGLGDSAYNIIPMLTVRSSNGVKTSNLFLNNNKIVGVSKTAVTLEFKESESLNSPRINPTTIQSGIINVLLILT